MAAWLLVALGCLPPALQKAARAYEPAVPARTAAWYGNALFIYHLDNHARADTTMGPDAGGTKVEPPGLKMMPHETKDASETCSEQQL